MFKLGLLGVVEMGRWDSEGYLGLEVEVEVEGGDEGDGGKKSRREEKKGNGDEVQHGGNFEMELWK